MIQFYFITYLKQNNSLTLVEASLIIDYYGYEAIQKVNLRNEEYMQIATIIKTSSPIPMTNSSINLPPQTNI